MKDEGSRLFDETVIARLRLQKWLAGAVAALFVLRLAAEVVPVMRRPDLLLLDAWQSLRGTHNPSSQVAIVAVDEKSIARFGPPAWPRKEYVPLIERLSQAGAKVIGFDFTFGALEREAENNGLLADAMSKAGNVVFGYEFARVGDPAPAAAPPSNAILANALPRFESVAVPPAPALIEPEPVLAAAAAALGHVHTIESDDGRIRVLPLVIEHAGKGYPSLALQVARVYTGTPLRDVGLKGSAVGMGDWTIPVSASGEVLLDWPAEGVKAFPQYSFLDVVRGDVPDEAFRGKAVLVAGTASGLDDRGFPFAAKAPGVLIYATFLDNVFRFDFVQAPTWAWVFEWGVFAAVCGLGLWLLPRTPTRPLLIGVPALVVLLLGSAAFLYVQKGIWVKTAFPVLALLVPLAMLVVMRLTASEKVTRDVVAEKLENEKLLGLSFQEKGMLDMALATFNKLPFSQDMKLIFVNLGLDYENRGQRDKAYRVYKKVYDVDPGFEDIARRMERLVQAGVGTSAFPAPTFSGSVPPTPAGPDLPTAGAVAPVPGRAPTMVLPAAATPVPGAPQGTSVTVDTGRGAQGPSHPTQQLPATRMGPAGAGSMPVVTGPVGPGTRFGRYEVERHLGRGGMGDVYQVRDTVINRLAALKTIRVDADLDAKAVIEMRQRFYREAQTAGQLTHPNIVTVYDVVEDLGMSYIVMEFIEGQTLAQLMKKQRFNVAQIKHVIYHSGMGLDYAHQSGVFHRDVKPDNIMVSKSGAVKVMDFGIARVVESTLTRTGHVMGTPAYMSPEQVNGQKIDARSDIFSLGVILYELLTGKKPFTGETIPSLMFAIVEVHPAQPSAVDAQVHKAWDEILRRALAKDRDQRYATARELAQAVKDAPVR